MTSVCMRCLGAALLVTVSWYEAAQAAPVELQFSGIAQSPYGANAMTPGVSPGDMIIFDVFADNGGTSLDSQSWGAADVVSASIQAGSYSASTMGPATILFSGGFTTDVSGELATLSIGMFQYGTDTNLDPKFVYYMDQLNDIWYAYNSDGNLVSSFGAVSPPDISNTTISLVSATPLPAALPLFAGGLGAMGLLGWRRKRKVGATVAA